MRRPSKCNERQKHALDAYFEPSADSCLGRASNVKGLDQHKAFGHVKLQESPLTRRQLLFCLSTGTSVMTFHSLAPFLSCLTETIIGGGPTLALQREDTSKPFELQMFPNWRSAPWLLDAATPTLTSGVWVAYRVLRVCFTPGFGRSDSKCVL